MKKTSFLWKLTENYLNAIMVLVLMVLVISSMIYEDSLYFYLAIVWVLVIPFIGTFIDMKSNSRL